jgi:hypothetical protein
LEDGAPWPALLEDLKGSGEGHNEDRNEGLEILFSKDGVEHRLKTWRSLAVSFKNERSAVTEVSR